MLKAEFEMKDIGATKKILYIEIQRDRKKRLLRLSHYSYIEKVLQQFRMSNLKPAIILFAQHFKQSTGDSTKTEEEKMNMARVSYASAMGSITYLMIFTRPDLAHLVSVMNRYMSALEREYWQGIKWMMGYFRGHSEHELF